MRWVYVKNGDVATQLERLGANPQNIPEGGPDAFFGDFLTHIGDEPLLAMSCSNEERIVKDANAIARVYRPASLHFGKPGKLARILYAAFSGGWMMLRFKPDRLICGRLGALLQVSYVVARLLRIPWIHSRHNSIKQGGAGLFKRLQAGIDKAMIRRADGVICHGPFLAKEAREFGVNPDRIYMFDVGYTDYLEQAREAQLPPALSGRHDGRLVVFVGRVEAGKGIFDLLEAATKLLERHQDTSLVYIGDGPDLIALRKRVTQAGLDNRITILGRVTHNETAAVVRAATVAVTPTRSEFPEGRCMSAMEALVLGIPLVAPELGPFPYLVSHGENGLLYRADSVSELTDRLEQLFSDRELLECLQAGAATSGRQLLTPEYTFYQAVQRAFGDR